MVSRWWVNISVERSDQSIISFPQGNESNSLIYKHLIPVWLYHDWSHLALNCSSPRHSWWTPDSKGKPLWGHIFHMTWNSLRWQDTRNICSTERVLRDLSVRTARCWWYNNKTYSYSHWALSLLGWHQLSVTSRPAWAPDWQDEASSWQVVRLYEIFSSLVIIFISLGMRLSALIQSCFCSSQKILTGIQKNE